MGLLYGYETADGYVPSLWRQWSKPKVSGNTINGLGEKTVRRPTPFYHRQDFWHPWRIIQDMFYFRVMPFWSISYNRIRIVLLDRKKTYVPIATKRVEASPQVWAKRIKDYAKSIGIDKVGIVESRPEWAFDGDNLRHKYAIILATRMDFDALSCTVKRDFVSGLDGVMAIYYYGHKSAKKLANWLREQGWEVLGTGNPMGTPPNLVPAAIKVGIGMLGKRCGSLMC